MAERRMFHASVINSDAFLDLPPQTQALYFHLGMGADDDGFVNGPRQVVRKLGLSSQSLQQLIDAGFLLDFDGIVVLRHWRVANYLKTDRLQLPRYPDLARKLYLDENKIYTKTRIPGEQNLLCQKKDLIRTHGIHSESQKRREEKKREEKKKEEKKIEEPLLLPDEPAATAAAQIDPLKFMNGKLGKGVVLLTNEQIELLLDRMGLDSFDYYVEKLAHFILDKGAIVKNHYATILKWWEEDRRIQL